MAINHRKSRLQHERSRQNVIRELLSAGNQSVNESSLPREPEADHTSGRYDVTIRSAVVKSQAHLKPVSSNG